MRVAEMALDRDGFSTSVQGFSILRQARCFSSNRPYTACRRFARKAPNLRDYAVVGMRCVSTTKAVRWTRTLWSAAYPGPGRRPPPHSNLGHNLATALRERGWMRTPPSPPPAARRVLGVEPPRRALTAALAPLVSRRLPRLPTSKSGEVRTLLRRILNLPFERIHLLPDFVNEAIRFSEVGVTKAAVGDTVSLVYQV